MLKDLFGSPKKAKTPAQAQPAKPAAAAPTPNTGSVLGANTHFEGTLRAEGNIRIEGTFIGDITTRGRIVIGELGKVNGDLIGESVETAGTVNGNVIARKVSVMRTGRILGDLRLEKMATEEGGFIQGLVTMEEAVDISKYLPATVKEPESIEEKAKEEAEATPKPEPVKAEAKPEVKVADEPNGEKAKVTVTAKTTKGQG